MILQALTHYYEVLSYNEKIAPFGWGTCNVSYAICISNTGELEQVICLKTDGKKQEMRLPVSDKHDNSGTDAHFLCDNAKFLLGISVHKDDAKEAAREFVKSRRRFDSSKELHLKLLSGVDTPIAKAIISFFKTWDCTAASDHPKLKDCMEDLLKGDNLIFRCNFSYPHNDDDIKKAWNQYYTKQSELPKGICMVTGKSDFIEATHPVIKRVNGANPMGAALVSFNAPAFCSYG